MTHGTGKGNSSRLGLVLALVLVWNAGFGLVLRAAADPVSPLTVTTTASPSPVASGTELTYTISIVNTGGSKVTNAVLTDQVNGVGGIGVPPQLVLTTSKGSCTQSAATVSCAIGTIAGGGSVTVTIRGIVTAAAGTTLNNTASVTGTRSAQNFTTSSTIQTLVEGGGGGSPLADLSISKAGPGSAVVGEAIKYVLTVNNSGNANATDIVVVDTLPAGVGFVSADATSLFVCLDDGGTPVTVTCSGGAVNAGKNASITINATAPIGVGSIANTAVVDPENAIEESNDLNNTSATVSTSVTSAPAPAGLTITNTDAPDPVVPGAILTYVIVVKNISTTRADDVVTVNGTQGLEAASITASQVIVNGAIGTGGGCVVSAPQVRCSIRSLNPGGTQTITIKGQVVASAGSKLVDTATATANVKNTGVRATATAQTTVKPAVDLTITKSDSPDPVCARSWPNGISLGNPPDGLTAASGSVPPLLAAPGCLGGLTYTITVGNSGIQVASNVVVRDPLPEGLIFDSWDTNAGFVCGVNASNVVTCSGGTVPAESIKQIRLRFVAPDLVGSITNTITVDPSNAIYEADETNNTFTQATTVTTGVDLVIRKDDSWVDPPGVQNVEAGFDPIASNGTQTYTITVDNVGTQDVPGGIKLADTLPADTRFLSVVSDTDHGFTCTHDGSATGGVIECVGGRLLGTESEFYEPAGGGPAGLGDDIATILVHVFARPTLGTMSNEVRVDPDNTIAEYNEDNNVDTEDTTVTNGGASLSAYNELSIVKMQTSPVNGLGDPLPVATNGTLKYRITVTNDATDPALEIHVRDFLPAGARFIEARDTEPGSDAFHCTQAGGQIDCIGGTLDGTLDLLTTEDQTRTIDITVFAPNTPGDYSNQAIVDPLNDIPEGNEFNNNSTFVTKVRTAGSGGENAFNELSITKDQVSPPGNVVSTSSVVIYHVVVSNTGTDPAFNVVVKDTLPTGFAYIEAKDLAPGAQAFTCTSGAGNIITCEGATLSGTAVVASGLPTQRTIEIRAYSSAIPGNYTNTAIVDPANLIPEGDETNNMAEEPTKVLVGAGFIDLQIEKSGPAKVVPGGLITYTLTVTNAGSDPAFNVKVRDDLPAGTVFVSASDQLGGAGAFTCSLVGTSVLCTGGTLDGGVDDWVPGVGQTRNIIVKVLAPADIDALAPNQADIWVDIINQAVIDPDNAIAESNETNNSASRTTTVRSKVNLSIEKSGPTTATQNSQAEYKIEVTNTAFDGGAVAFDVLVRDPLPIGLIPLSIEVDGNFRCQITENPVNTVSCIGDLEPDQTITIKVKVFVTAESGPLDNQACVDRDEFGNGTIAETNELDNCNNAITQVVPPAPDLLINKSASTGVVSPEESLTYTITVSNAGDAATTDPVVVTDNLPDSVTLTNATATNGFVCVAAGTPTVVTCTGASGLAAGASTTIDILTTVKAGVTEPFTNEAFVGNVTGELNTSNNGPVTVTTNVGGSGIDLQVVSITDTPDPANITEALTYVVVVTNNGASTAGTLAAPAKVRIDLPPTGVSFTAADGSNGFNCSLAGSTLTCEGIFPGGGSTIITVTLGVVSGAPPELKAVAIADPLNAFIESNEGNNSLTQVTTVSNSLCTTSPCIDLVMAQVLGSPNPVKTGTTHTATFDVVNVGDMTTGPGGNALVDLLLAGDFSAPAITVPAGFACVVDSTYNAPPLIWYACTGDLAAGLGATFTITSTAGAAGGTIDAYGFVSVGLTALEPDFNPGNNSGSYSTNVIA